MFISGDVHFTEITRYDCAIRYPLYDVTSSGITQGIEKALPPLVFRFMAWVTPSTMRVFNSNCRYKSCTYGNYFYMTFFFVFYIIAILYG